ncbi:MAG: metallophosphoesterase, partial [Gemmataceae bacterium]|nr:metallophosphoesterase [Gemmataceae bacterium]
ATLRKRDDAEVHIHSRDLGCSLQAPDLQHALAQKGTFGLIQALLKAADLANHPRRHFVIQEVIHGNFRYPNGSDKSHQLVDLFAALKCQFPRQAHYLPGNHELAQWTGRKVLKADADLNALFEEGVTAAYGPQFGPEIYRTYLELFRALPLVVRTANGVVVSHSLPPARTMTLFDPARLERDDHDDADLQPGGTVHSLLWGRDTKPQTAADYLGKMGAGLLVSGHIASDAGFGVPNDRQVIVDCAESPAGYVLFPADRPLTHQELVGCIRTF